MDLVAVVNESIARLPEGSHTPGLNAVRRHIAAAIRHFERDDTKDPDSYTDSIYRTNQAFEGSLKEAYRVLTGEDPSRLTPYQIEGYLEDKKLIRPRALKQLTRYREDYRNPSTHDYKLDFDADESLLAIVSVCAFTRLLSNQIAAKLASNAVSEAGMQPDLGSFDSLDKLAEFTAALIADALAVTSNLKFSSDAEMDYFVDEVLIKAGFSTNLIDTSEVAFDDDNYPWSNVVTVGNLDLPIETRTVVPSALETAMKWIDKATQSRRPGRIVLAFTDGSKGGNYLRKRLLLNAGERAYLVYPEDSKDLLEATFRSIGKLVL